MVQGSRAVDTACLAMIRGLSVSEAATMVRTKIMDKLPGGACHAATRTY